MQRIGDPVYDQNELPIKEGGVHYSSEGYIMPGKATASAIEEFSKQ